MQAGGGDRKLLFVQAAVAAVPSLFPAGTSRSTAGEVGGPRKLRRKDEGRQEAAPSCRLTEIALLVLHVARIPPPRFSDPFTDISVDVLLFYL